MWLFCGFPNSQYERHVHAVPKRCASLTHCMRFKSEGRHHGCRVGPSATAAANAADNTAGFKSAGSRRVLRLRLLLRWASSCGTDLRVTPRPHPCGAVMGGPPPAGPGPPQAGPHIVPGLRLLWLQASSCGTDLRVTP